MRRDHTTEVDLWSFFHPFMLFLYIFFAVYAARAL